MDNFKIKRERKKNMYKKQNSKELQKERKKGKNKKMQFADKNKRYFDNSF